MRRVTVGAGALWLLLVLAAPARADVLILQDGRILERPKMERVEAGVKVVFEHGEVLVPAGQIEDAILEADANAPPKTDEERLMAEKGLVRYQGRWVKKDKRDEEIQKRIAARREAVEELRKHQLWRFAYKDESRHFTFQYTVAPFVFEHYRDMMEAYFDDFSKTWKVRQPKDPGKLPVCFYSDRDKFAQIANAHGGVLGYFRYVAPLELDFYYDRLEPDLTEHVMFHETNHYLQSLLNTSFSMPHFPGESLAEYYGASHYDTQTRKFETGLVLEGRLAEVKTDIDAGNEMSLEKLLKTDEMYEHYTWGWSLVHFLMSDKRYRKRFEAFVRDLTTGKGVQQEHDGANGMATVHGDEIYAHFRGALGLKKEEEFTAFENEWHAYVKDTLKFVTAAGFEKAAQAAEYTDRPIRAKRLYSEAIQRGTTNPMTYYAYGELLERDGKTDEAVSNYDKAIELGPLESEFYAGKGRALLSKDHGEAVRLLGLALELDPDNVWLEGEVKRALEEGKKGS